MPELKSWEQSSLEMQTVFYAETGVPPSTEEGAVNLAIFDAFATESESRASTIRDDTEKAVLEAQAILYGISRLQTQQAGALVTFGRLTIATSDILIPRGTQISTSSSDAITFETLADVTLLIGFTSIPNVPVRSLASGSITNVGPNTITVLNDSINGIETVTNPLAASGGTDLETDDDMLERVASVRVQEAKGTLPAIASSALTFVKTQFLNVPELEVISNDIGTDSGLSANVVRVDVYYPGPLSIPLHTAISTHLESQQQRPVGSILDVQRMTIVNEVLTVTIKTSSAADAALVETALRRYFQSIKSGIGSSIKLYEALAAQQAATITSVTITNTAPGTINRYSKLILNNLTVTVAP